MLSVDIKKRLPGGFTLDVRFRADGETLALLGASGCGKSLTLRCVAGVLRPDEGVIELNGRALFDSDRKINLPPQKRKIGYLFQQYSLFPNMTVAQNIALGVQYEKRDVRRAVAARWISAMHLDGLGNRRPQELSGGERQRVALARALASEPEALLFDEPFSALDDYLRWQVELELADTLREFRGPSVFVTHSRDEAYRLCGQVCVLQDGKSERQTSVKGLFRSPETLSAALISGCKNFSRAEALPDGRVRALDWGVELTVPDTPPPDTRFIGVRAHYIAPADRVDVYSPNLINCTVYRAIDDVFGSVIMLATPGGDSGYSLLRAEFPKSVWAALGNPKTLAVKIDPDDIMLLT
ncbi:MAG: ATP-binding cassette domain-containing protein [Oscillospiraceae bacterium]|jgi:molybdate transport system ATP-binding protein|nr:ATP-binding cassette domain-containing protein [Oscillospiraceae bacterium]